MTKYVVVAVYPDGDREAVIDAVDTRAEAERILLQCQEGADKHDPCEYAVEELSVLRVVVMLEFNDISDPNSPKADEIVQAVTDECYRMRVAFDANECWVEDVYVDNNHRGESK